MATCPNCKKTLTCGCQKRKATDGKAVCSNCITAYENKVKMVWAVTQNNTTSTNQQTTNQSNASYQPDVWNNWPNNQDNNKQ